MHHSSYMNTQMATTHRPKCSSTEKLKGKSFLITSRSSFLKLDCHQTCGRSFINRSRRLCSKRLTLLMIKNVPRIVRLERLSSPWKSKNWTLMRFNLTSGRIDLNNPSSNNVLQTGTNGLQLLNTTNVNNINNNHGTTSNSKSQE